MFIQLIDEIAVGVEEQEEGTFGQRFTRHLEELWQVVGELPKFTIFPPSEGWGIHDDTVVTIASADLPLKIFHRILDDIADRCFGKTR